LSTPEKVYINVLFTPESFCNIGYNDITLKAVETYSQIYGYEYSFCVPESIEEGMDYYQNWCEATLNDDIARSLFVFASSLYDEPLAKAPHPAADSRKDILIFELEKELPYAYTFGMTYYGASYMIGCYYLKQLPVDFQIIAANPYLGGLDDVVNAFTAATEDISRGTVNFSYIDESPSGGLDDPDGIYSACMVTYYMNQDNANIFIPYAGLSNLGVYRFSQSTHQPVVGVDCIDPNSFSHMPLSMNKKMDLALDDFLQLWIKGKEIPRHTLYTLESGRVTVDRHSILDVDSEILDQLFEQAIAKEKEYYQKQEVDESDL
jgi:hypothetical protein